MPFFLHDPRRRTVRLPRIFVLGLACALLLIARPGGALRISGVVLAQDGAPASGAGLWVCQRHAVQQAETDEEGGFSFEGLDVGPIDLVAYREGSAIDGVSQFLADDLALQLRLGPPGTLAFRVVSNAFDPLPGARLRALTYGERVHIPVGELAAHGFPVLRSGDDGVITASFLPAHGFAQLVVSHYRYADSNVAYLPIGRKRQNIVLYPGERVAGRVTRGGAGVPRAEVSIFRRTVGGERVFAQELTDSEGYYHARAPAGAYLVAARHPAYPTSLPQPVTLREDADNPPVDILFEAPLEVAGSIVLPDGSPCLGARVICLAADRLSEETLSGADGRFRVNVGASKLELRVLPPMGYMTEHLGTIAIDFLEKTQITVKPIQLAELPWIAGIVVDDEDQPAPGAVISSLNLDKPIWAVTDEEGRFDFRVAYMPEEGAVELRAEDSLRFLRRDIKAPLRHVEKLRVKLRRFAPDPSPGEPIPLGNDLSGLVDEPAPEIVCSEWFNSTPLSLDELRGRVAVVTFWGGFDDSLYGRNRIEELRALHAVYGGVEDVAIVGIHDGSIEPDQIEAYLHEFGIDFPVGRDADPSVSWGNYRITLIPQTVIIDKEGVFRYYQVEGRLLELIKVLRRRG